MPEDRKRRSVFISHSSANLAARCQIDERLHTAGLDPWLDYSNIRVGALLGKRLAACYPILQSEAVVMVQARFRITQGCGRDTDCIPHKPIHRPQRQPFRIEPFHYSSPFIPLRFSINLLVSMF